MPMIEDRKIEYSISTTLEKIIKYYKKYVKARVNNENLKDIVL